MHRILKPRDPFVQHLVKKKQGAMGPTAKQLKKRDRIALKKAMKTATYE